MIRKQILTFTMLAFLLTPFGCGSPETENAPAARDRGDDTAGIREFDEGHSVEGSLALPDGFPSDFPLPPDYEIYESRFVEGDFATRANYFVRGRSSADLVELVTFYRERLPEAGFELIHQPPESAPADNAMFYFQDETYSDATVQLRPDEGATDVLINLPLRD